MGRSRSRKVARHNQERAAGAAAAARDARAGAKLWANLRWGLGWGLAFGAAYSLLALLLYLSTGPAHFARIGVTPASAVAVYLVAGAGGGALLGLLRPLTRWRPGAVLVGMVACVPLSIGFLLAMQGSPANWQEKHIAGGIIAALLVGGMGGYQSWEEPSNKSANHS